MCVSCLQVFSIVVFATITAEGYINHHTSQETKCMFNENESACNYGVGIGVIAFLACVIMLIMDANFPQISNVKQRKIIVVGDFVFSGESPFFTSCSEQRNSTPKQEVKSRVSPHASTSCMSVLMFSLRGSVLDSPVVHLFLCPGQPVGPYLG